MIRINPVKSVKYLMDLDGNFQLDQSVFDNILLIIDHFMKPVCVVLKNKQTNKQNKKQTNKKTLKPRL